MTIRYCVVAVLLALVACKDNNHYNTSPDGLQTTMKNNPSIREGAVPLHKFPDGVAVFSMDDMDPAVAARLRAQAESPEFHAMLKASMERGPHQYAVSDAKLPENAMALIIRDPESPFAEVTVFHRDRLTDNGIAVARLALFEDQLAEPRVTARRHLLVWEDQTVKLGNATKQMHYNLNAHQPPDAASLRFSGKATLLPEVGEIRFVE